MNKKYRLNRMQMNSVHFSGGFRVNLPKRRASFLVGDVFGPLFMNVLPLLLLFSCGMIGACSYPDDYVQFKKLSLEQQKIEFARLDMDKQVDYYLYDMGQEPPHMGFDEDIARQGTAALPVLLRRIKQEPAYRQTYLIGVFEVMHVKFVALDRNQEVLEVLEDVVNRMTDPGWKRMSEKSLVVIRQERRAPSRLE